MVDTLCCLQRLEQIQITTFLFFSQFNIYNNPFQTDWLERNQANRCICLQPNLITVIGLNGYTLLKNPADWHTNPPCGGHMHQNYQFLLVIHPPPPNNIIKFYLVSIELIETINYIVPEYVCQRRVNLSMYFVSQKQFSSITLSNSETNCQVSNHSMTGVLQAHVSHFLKILNYEQSTN